VGILSVASPIAPGPMNEQRAIQVPSDDFSRVSSIPTEVVAATFTLSARSFHIVNSEAFIRNEEHGHVLFRTRTMFHDLSFRKPDKGSRTELSLMGY
jgi:hypothetical protein